MSQKIKKNFAKGIIISGLTAVVLGCAGISINNSRVEELSSQRKRLSEYNNQIYYFSKENPLLYNQNSRKINDLQNQIQEYEQSNGYSKLLLAGGIAFYPLDKNNS